MGPKKRGRPPGTGKHQIAKRMAEESKMSQETTRPPLRAEMRPPVQEDSRLEAERRAKEIMENLEGVNLETVDEFWAPPAPDGWTYEWKVRTVLNQEDPSRQRDQAQMGWEPVPRDRHPEMMPSGDYSVIERKGMILMQRPKQVTDMIRNRDKKRARDQVKAKEEQLGAAPDGTIQRTLADVRKSFAPVVIPDE